jgi:hypothetical protein
MVWEKATLLDPGDKEINGEEVTNKKLMGTGIAPNIQLLFIFCFQKSS